MTRAGAIALLGTVAALVVFDAGEWLVGRSRQANIGVPAQAGPQTSDRQPAAGETGPAEGAVESWLTTVLGRPLMTPSRRPAASAGGASLALTGGLPRLAGTVFKQDGAIAIFARGDSGGAVIVHEGGTLGPYHVTRIAPNSVVLEGPGGTQTLHPRFGQASTAVGVENGFPPPLNMPGVLPQMPGVMQPYQPPPNNQ